MGEANRRQFLKGAIGIGIPARATNHGSGPKQQPVFNLTADALYVWKPDVNAEKVSEALRLLEANRVFYSFPKNRDSLSSFLQQGHAVETHALLSTVEISNAVTKHQRYINQMQEIPGIDGIHLNHESRGKEKDEWLEGYLNYLSELDSGNLEVSITLDWKWFDTAVDGTLESTIQRARAVREHDTVDWVVVMPYHVNASVVANRIQKSMGENQSGEFSRKPFLFAVETQNPRTNAIHENATIYGKNYSWVRNYLSEIRQNLPRVLNRNLMGGDVAVHNFRALVNQAQTFPNRMW